MKVQPRSEGGRTNWKSRVGSENSLNELSLRGEEKLMIK